MPAGRINGGVIRIEFVDENGKIGVDRSTVGGCFEEVHKLWQEGGCCA